MDIKAIILAGVAAGAVTLAYPKDNEYLQSPPAITFYNGITIQYDAAGNRVFRSLFPIIEINPNIFVYEDSTNIAPHMETGGEDMGPVDSLITP